MRTAIIRRPGTDTAERITAYLPVNYQAQGQADGTILITGNDVAGWTLDDYVIPRLASGLIFAEEINQ